MSNLNTLNDIAFRTLERLADPKIKGNDLIEEIERAKAISSASKDILVSAKLTLDAAKLTSEYGNIKIPEMFTMQKKIEHK